MASFIRNSTARRRASAALFTIATAISGPVFAASDCVFADNFQCAPDREAPTIQIAPPSDWLQSNQVEVTVEDASGLAESAFDIRASGSTELNTLGASLRPFLRSTTSATKNITISNLVLLLGKGVELTAFAEDVFGNFSRRSETFQLDSPIQLGTYGVQPIFESEEVSATHCPLQTFDPDSLKLRVASLGVDAYFALNDPDNSPINLRFDSAKLLGTSTSDGSEERVATFIPEAGVNDLSDATHAGPIRIASGGLFGANFRFGASIDVTFNKGSPETLTAAITAYCFTENSSGSATGCPVDDYENCDVDTFGPFTVEGTLQIN